MHSSMPPRLAVIVAALPLMAISVARPVLARS
jgi:hypothetical protein